MIENVSFQPWICDPQEHIANNDVLKTTDDVLFPTIVQTCNLLFKTAYKQGRGATSGCFLPAKLRKHSSLSSVKLWFPKLAIENDGVFNSASSNWNNRLNIDKSIIEFKDNVIKDVDKNYVKDAKNEEDVRLVFAKSTDPLGRNGYRFIGKYQKTKKIAVEHNGQYVKVEYYQKISDECPIVGSEE